MSTTQRLSNSMACTNELNRIMILESELEFQQLELNRYRGWLLENSKSYELDDEDALKDMDHAIEQMDKAQRITEVLADILRNEYLDDRKKSLEHQLKYLETLMEKTISANAKSNIPSDTIKPAVDS